MKNVLLILSIALLAGCIPQPTSTVNPFGKFYQNTIPQMPPSMQQRLLPPSGGPPQIETVARTQLDDERTRMLEHGFAQIGFSSFDGPPATRQQLIEQAQHVGADAVVLTGEYARTTEGQIPSLSYQPGQTYTTQERGTATANTFGGSGSTYGYGTYSGSSTTTTPGTFQTQYTPYQIAIYSQGAIFWRRSKPYVFGALCVPIPYDLRTKLQRNTGALVSAVVEGSPAFNANILHGDVIIQFADTAVSTPQDLFKLTAVNAGQTVSISLIRGVETKVLEVHLNPDPAASPINGK